MSTNTLLSTPMAKRLIVEMSSSKPIQCLSTNDLTTKLYILKKICDIHELNGQQCQIKVNNLQIRVNCTSN